VADIARDAAVGGTVPYTYFPNKQTLFFAALDEDGAAAIEAIDEGLSPGVADYDGRDWWEKLLVTVFAVVDRHPLVRRVLAGLEPEVSNLIVDTPALARPRKELARRLAAEQRAGKVRRDIDPVPVANGTVTIVLALLRGMVQLGEATTRTYHHDIATVLAAALDPPAPP
jgi:AcrR family transcriptional regulator